MKPRKPTYEEVVAALRGLLDTAIGEGNEGEPGYQVHVDGKEYEKARALLERCPRGR